MFNVVTRGFSQKFERWTDALYAAKSLMPKCNRWTDDIRIFLCDELIWVYSKSHKYPQYIGAGTYDRLAQLFLQEAMDEEASTNLETEAPEAESPS